MTDKTNPQQQLPPTRAIAPTVSRTDDGWFEYPVRSHPHHTDYAGVVWHGTYLTWMEEARIESLRSIGIDYAQLAALGCDFPLVELSMRYHKPMRLGVDAVVRTRMSEIQGVRLNWEQEIQSLDGEELYVKAVVILVACDMAQGKIIRRLPPPVQDALVKLSR
jgi:acyl-CoA thioester hydrolase